MTTKKSSTKQTKSAEQRPAKRKKIMSLAEYEADKKGGEAPAASTAAHVPPGSNKSEPAKPKRPSALDAAVAVLAEAEGPMTCQAMIDWMLKVGLWRTTGKTPAGTLHAAISREIVAKGAASRFRKVDRGRFELVK